VGEAVILYGYLGPGRRRDISKKLSFWSIISPEDSKHVQIVSFNKDNNDDHAASLKRLHLYTQSPVAIKGTVRAKKLPKDSPEAASTWLEHERIEIDLIDVTPLNSFPPEIPYIETTRFNPSHRHLDIRKSLELKSAIEFRAKTASHCRKLLEEQGFQEVETPILFKSTPEGAREFLVPTRVKGMAYALPQSPQQYKQILMASGIP
jgi:aspartyl-tRNA synthetase